MREKTKQTQFNDSITGVNPKRTHGLGVYHGERVAWAVRVDKTLLKQAKPILTAKFGSFCRGVESWLAGLVAVEHGKQLVGVNPSNTSIGKLVIERNVRTRRKLVEEQEETMTEKVEVVRTSCGFCMKDAVGLFQHESGRREFACPYHSNLLKDHPKWSFLNAVSLEES